MTHSLRTLFRCMLFAWFALVLVMALALKAHLPSETAGTLVESLFTRPALPLPAPVLRLEAPPLRPIAMPEPVIEPQHHQPPPPPGRHKKAHKAANKETPDAPAAPL
jgi:hypothetical protein